jgi:hypothetical protein
MLLAVDDNRGGAVKTAESLLKGAVGFKRARNDDGAPSENGLFIDREAHEGFAVALPPGVVPGEALSLATWASLRRTAGSLFAAISAPILARRSACASRIRWPTVLAVGS